MAATHSIEHILRRGGLFATAPAGRSARAYDKRDGDRDSQRALVIASLLRCPKQGSNMPSHGHRA